MIWFNKGRARQKFKSGFWKDCMSMSISFSELLKLKPAPETKEAKLPWNAPRSELQGARVHNGAAYTENTEGPKSQKLANDQKI